MTVESSELGIDFEKDDIDLDEGETYSESVAIHVDDDFAGLLVDVAKGSLLGQHALASLIIVFLTTKYHLQIRNVPQIQLLTTVVFLLVIFQFTLFWINGVSGISASFRDYWGPIVSSAIIWPIFSRILSKYFVYTSSKEKI